nr:serine/threonine-protein kinase VRK1-like [Penaeus vannamei]
MAKLGGAGGAPIPLGFCPETPALLMTCCGSHNLEGQKDLGDRLLLQIGVRLVQALQELHLHDVIHCDLKPDNVTLQFTEDGQLHALHVIDYGFACPVGGSHPRRKTQDPKPWYCHCFYNGTPMRKECDVQGLGYILEFLEEAMTQESLALDDLIARAFEPEHEKRPTLQEVEALLSSLLASLGETEAEAEDDVEAEEESRPRTRREAEDDVEAEEESREAEAEDEAEEESREAEAEDDVEAEEESREALEERRGALSLPLRRRPVVPGPPSAPAFLSLQTDSATLETVQLKGGNN